jgi:hypothetical protein
MLTILFVVFNGVVQVEKGKETEIQLKIEQNEIRGK